MIFLGQLGVRALLVFAVSLFLGLLAFLYAWGERTMAARAQQRHGIALYPGRGFAAVLGDFAKVLFKDRSSHPAREKLLMFLGIVLPFVFYNYLFQVIGSPEHVRGEIFLLFFLLVIGLLLQRILVFAPSSLRERFALSHNSILMLLAATALMLSALPATILSGSGSLQSIRSDQRGFPFFLILESPGFLISGITGFIALLIMTQVGPAQAGGDLLIENTWARAFAWIQRLWAVCLISLWVALHFGGIPSGILSFFSFVFRLFLVSVVLLWVQVSYPRSRATDLSLFLLKIVFPLSLLGMLVQVLWMAFGRMAS